MQCFGIGFIFTALPGQEADNKNDDSLGWLLQNGEDAMVIMDFKSGDISKFMPVSLMQYVMAFSSYYDAPLLVDTSSEPHSTCDCRDGEKPHCHLSFLFRRLQSLSAQEPLESFSTDKLFGGASPPPDLALFAHIVFQWFDVCLLCGSYGC